MSLILALAAAAAEPAGSARLTIAFDTAAGEGAVLVSLFDGEAAYRGGAPVRQARVDIARGERSAVFAGLPPGDYAARAFHDLDGDGRLSLNPFGIPVEPVGFSNDARGEMGPAPWERARFRVAGETAQTMTVR
ncbi:MAG: DUF2141 domain-containing protein [Allosphingosinicella sp.]|uniref:DUF2141 domain-containing protein n=1 Tax=Allosphingosinicella sp. TaxID=2823234 RepID=UPI003963DCC5